MLSRIRNFVSRKKEAAFQRAKNVLHTLFPPAYVKRVDTFRRDDFSWDDNVERRKYLELYLDPERRYANTQKDGAGYGGVNWGAGAYPLIEQLAPKSLCDVGCGQGQFCVAVAERGIVAHGVDIAAVASGRVLPHPLVTYHDAVASKLPLADKSVDVVTTFDVLEHCAEKDVPQIMAEFARVARRAIVARVAYRQAGERSFHGEFLHLTVRDEEWWLAQLARVSRAEKWGEYLVGYLS